MPLNPIFNYGESVEQEILEDILMECDEMMGIAVWYIPREIVQMDKMLREGVETRFSSAYELVVYPEDIDGFQGGTMFDRFGMSFKDQYTFSFARKRWRELIGSTGNAVSSERPVEGDLIYFGETKALMVIKFVEHETPFYVLNDIPTFQITCEMFQYQGEEFDTDVEDLNTVVQTYQTAQFFLKVSEDSITPDFNVGEWIDQDMGNGVVISGLLSMSLPDTTGTADLRFDVSNVRSTDPGVQTGFVVDDDFPIVGRTTGAVGFVREEGHNNDGFRQNEVSDNHDPNTYIENNKNPFGGL